MRTTFNSSGIVPLITQFIQRGHTFLRLAAGSLARHPKRVSAIVSALLLGAGGGAFALASLAPDASELPVREVLESVQPALTISPFTANAVPLNLYRADITRSTDTADTLLKRLGVDDVVAANYLRTDQLARQMLLGRAGRNVTAETHEGQHLRKLVARWSPDDSGQFQRLVIERTPKGFVSRLESAPLVASTRLASAAIRTSLFAATDDAGLPDAIATQLAEMFSGDIDFRRALRKDDRFNLVYEVLEGDGEPMRTGRVLSAEFVNAGKAFQAMWFQPPGKDAQGVAHKGGYYTLDGQSLRRAFLSSPVEFSRVSSGFSMRFHPILKNWRAHLGTDFAASTGTPARTVGDGVVEFAGTQNGYGNVIFVRHRNNTETVYAHLSKIMVNRGQSVSQGQTIGLVGSSGWATGPHLHFEVRVNGVQHDPMTMAQKSETVPVPAAVLPLFRQVAGNVRSELQAAASISQTRFQ
jgi:murein DD-endopeptidase MepM/ murein hydrolase activator NlpD